MAPQAAVQCRKSVHLAEMSCPLRSRMKLVKVTNSGQQFSDFNKVTIYVDSFLDVLVQRRTGCQTELAVRAL